MADLVIAPIAVAAAFINLLLNFPWLIPIILICWGLYYIFLT